jgi:hypothetical protein
MKQRLFIIFGLLVAVLAACTNPFTTRADKVEKPNVTDIQFEIPNEPENVLNNFKRAITNKNVQEYMNCFSPDPLRYRFDPEQYYFEDFQATGWSLDHEQDFFNQLTKSVMTLNFGFVDPEEPALNPIYLPAAEDSVETGFSKYQMTVNYSIDSSQVFSGLTRFKLFHDHDKDTWYIYYWQDKAENDAYNLTTTALKTQYK